MKKGVVFILTSSVNPNSIKRIDEFVSRGYQVKAYGFKRDVEVPNKSRYVDIEILGNYKNNLSYYKRCSIIRNGIKRVIRDTEWIDCVYYLVGLDVAMFFRLQTKKAYFFEEADMVHTNIKVKAIKNIYECIDRSIIKHSLLSAFRSEGFIRYHFGENVPNNVCVITNRLNVSIKDFDVLPKKDIDINHLKIGYVGFIRYSSILNFAKVFCKNFPQHEFHFYGTFPSEETKKRFSELESYNNCFFHGSFKSPDELNRIYSQIDMVLSSYDISAENVRYAEPNKIYESIYFETPIVVSSGTFLAQKVERLGIGYDINAMDDESIVAFVESLTHESIQKRIDNIRLIDKKEVLNINDSFFELLNEKLKK